MSLPQLIRETFLEKYGAEPLLIRSPGRINLIGEHTDYNEGYVLPAAIDKYIYLAFARNSGESCRVYSRDFEQEQTFMLRDMRPGTGWINFVMGVAAQLAKAGYVLDGFDCVFGGDIPIGAGLSSSAALENGVGMGLSTLFELNVDRLDLVKYSQQAEHEFAGVKCGIMDMFASMMGKEQQAIRLDCRSLDYAYFPVDLGDHQWLLCDSRVSHSLADSAYNERREECRQGVTLLQAHYPQVSSLRDVNYPQLSLVKDQLPDTVFQRCSFVIQENERVIQSCEALERKDLDRLGAYLYRSHEGLSRDYEVSCPELDFLVEFTRELPEVMGSRMMGGGFGGCTLNLVKKSARQAFIDKISTAYHKRFGIHLKAYEVNAVDGTERYFQQ